MRKEHSDRTEPTFSVWQSCPYKVEGKEDVAPMQQTKTNVAGNRKSAINPFNEEHQPRVPEQSDEQLLSLNGTIKFFKEENINPDNLLDNLAPLLQRKQSIILDIKEKKE